MPGKGGTWLLESFGSGSLEVAIENGTLQHSDLHDMHGGSWRLGRLALMPWSKTWRPPLSWLGSGKRDETGPMVCRRSWSADHGPMGGRRQLSFCASFSLSFALFKAIASYCKLLQAIACYCCLFVCLVKVQHGAAIDIQFNFRL